MMIISKGMESGAANNIYTEIEYLLVRCYWYRMNGTHSTGLDNVREPNLSKALIKHHSTTISFPAFKF